VFAVRATIVAAMCTAGAVSGSGQSPAPPPLRAPARALVRQVDQRIRELQAQADRLAAQSKTLLTELRGLELQRSLKAAEAKKAEVELTALQSEHSETATRLATLESQRIAESPGVSERLVEIYKRGRGGYWRLLLRSQDLRAVGRMARGVASVAQLDQVRFDAHRKTIRAERDALAELAVRQQAVSAATAEATRARRALDQAVAAHNQRIDQVDRERDLAAQYVGELQEAQSALQSRVGGLASGTAALPLAPFRGSLEWPVSGRVVARYGRSTDRFGAALVRNGIEIGAADGEAVKAVHGGSVAFAAPFTGFGTLVIVDHGGGAFTLYGHLADAAVAQGGAVERGTVVGHAGRTPAGQPALYFELRIDGRPVDPVQWFKAGIR